MKHRLFLVGVFSVFSLLVSFESIAANSGIAQVHAKVPNTEAKLSALTYLKNMNKAYKQLNYKLLYINTGKNKIEPKQLIHGVINGKRITYFGFLNGEMRESVQFDGKISFYEQGNKAYSLVTRRDQSVFANIANFDFDSGSKSYEYIILGKDRLAGKRAIAIRMVSKDEFRYSYIVWLDLKSYLPLRLDTINKSNLIIEQTMAVSLNVTKDINPWVAQLSSKKAPKVLHIPSMTIDEIPQWQIHWLPEGFKVIKDDQHKLMMHDTDPVSYIMISDGIVAVSIYISSNNTSASEHKNIIQLGGTLLYTKLKDDIEVNIIGEIPVATAEKIVTSIKVTE